MIHDDNFRSRSQLVRQSARAHLLDIRRARLANRAAPQPAAPGATDLTADGSSPMETPIEVMPEAAGLHPEEHNTTIVPPDAPPEPATVMDALEQAAVHSVGLPDPHDLADEPLRSEPASNPAASLDIYADVAASALPDLPEPQPTDPPAVAMAAPDVTETLTDADLAAPVLDLPQDDAGDLIALPGAGPGLIWMLQQCGITTLRDLAKADAADLTPKLGLVGQILNVQSWLDYARSQMSLS